jgi:hypothetical protein
MYHTLPAVLLLLLTFTACAAESDTTEPHATAPDTLPIESQPAPAQTQPQSQSDDDSAGSWLERIEAAANDVTTLTAKLRYDRNQLLLGDEQRRFGKLEYEAGPPPRFSVHFDKKLVDGHPSRPDLYYIYDGRWLLKRDHENKTAVRYELVPDDAEAGGAMGLGEGPFPIPLNLKKDRVLTKFNVTVIPITEEDLENSIHLQLSPREDNETDLTMIDLWFDRDSLLPVEVSTLDNSESQTIVRLTEIQANEPLADQSFDTSLPIEPGWQTDENRIKEEAE